MNCGLTWIDMWLSLTKWRILLISRKLMFWWKLPRYTFLELVYLSFSSPFICEYRGCGPFPVAFFHFFESLGFWNARCSLSLCNCWNWLSWQPNQCLTSSTKFLTKQLFLVRSALNCFWMLASGFDVGIWNLSTPVTSRVLLISFAFITFSTSLWLSLRPGLLAYSFLCTDSKKALLIVSHNVGLLRFPHQRLFDLAKLVFLVFLHSWLGWDGEKSRSFRSLECWSGQNDKGPARWCW